MKRYLALVVLALSIAAGARAETEQPPRYIAEPAVNEDFRLLSERVDQLEKKEFVDAWAYFDGSGTPTMTRSFNFSSTITDNGTGDWTLTFTNAFEDANFVCVATAEHATQTDFVVISAKTTTSVRILSVSDGAVAQDAKINVMCTR